MDRKHDLDADELCSEKVSDESKLYIIHRSHYLNL